MQKMHNQFMTPVSSSAFLDELYCNTMQSLIDRTREDGFCRTSYGELNDVKCYTECHYSRDACEAAWVLADQGCTDTAMKILQYTLRNTPQNQYYIVHAFRPDGTPLHNHIQIDTPAHPARALARALEMGADPADAEELFRRLEAFFQAAHEHHFHSECNLYDSGNFNEQLGGGNEPLLDMFTNGAMYAGLLAMARSAELLHHPGDTYRAAAARLADGIELHLYDPEHHFYRAALHADGTECPRPVNWINLYPARWYPGRIDAWRNVSEYLWTHGLNQWYSREIPSGESNFMTFRTMGKVIGQLLGFAARERRADRVETLLRFLEETVRKPDNLYPEYWLHHLPERGQSPYMDWFFDEFRGVWTSFTDDPDGDYTVDSGNCEQCSVYLAHFSNEIIGFRGDWRRVEVAPFLAGYGSFEVRNRSLGVRDEVEVHGSFRLDDGKLEFSADAPVEEIVLAAGGVRETFRHTAAAWIYF